MPICVINTNSCLCLAVSVLSLAFCVGPCFGKSQVTWPCAPVRVTLQ